MKTKLLFLGTLFLAFCNTQAQVTLPFYEGFNYTTGDLLITAGARTGLGSWTIPSFQSVGSSTDPDILASPTWTLPTNLPAQTGNALEFVGGGDDPVLMIPNQGSTGKIYSSFMMRITDQTGVTTNNPGYFYSFAKVASNGTSLNYTSCVYATKVTEGTFNLGISENNNTTNAVFTTTPLTTNTDYFVVITYDIDNSVSSMWINPVVNGTEPTAPYITNETATSQRTDLTMVRLNLDSNAKTGSFIMDEIRIGNTWISVAPSTTLAVSETKKSSLAIYPNPAKNYFVVENKNNSPIKSVTIYSAEGRLVKQIANPRSKQIDISTFSKGVYFVKIVDEKNEVSQKLIVD